MMIASLVAGVAMLLASDATAREIHGHHHAGDRQHFHGMVLFGKSTMFLAHIPTMTRPHNEQLIMRVTLEDADGEPIVRDFSRSAHSIRPSSTFSLDDLSVGKTKSFKGDVFAGNFEHGAPRILRDVTVRVEAVLVSRNLPGGDGGADFYLLGQTDTFLVDRIAGEESRQRIRRVTLARAMPGLSDDFAVQVDLATEGAGTVALLGKAGSAQATSVSVTVDAELWCLRAPDFFQPCR